MPPPIAAMLWPPCGSGADGSCAETGQPSITTTGANVAQPSAARAESEVTRPVAHV